MRTLKTAGVAVILATGLGWTSVNAHSQEADVKALLQRIALELAARVTQLDVDDDSFPIYANPATSATKATTWSLGANWHLNRNVKLSLDYDHTKFQAAAGNPLAAEEEDVIITRVQFAF